MHRHTLSNWQHSHRFHESNAHGERGTHYVIALTGVVMLVEIASGLITNSMALLADGWHMGTHLAALAIAAFAYAHARRHADDKRYTFGTGKVGTLGGFASAVFLVVIALLMAGESMHRLFRPLEIDFNWAIIVAIIGLAVNLLSAFLLRDREHSHHHDHNLRAAYLHVLADALTSLTAIVALVTGKYLGWVWMDPVMGIVGAVVICVWAYGLLRQTGRVLLDNRADPETAENIRKLIEADADNRIADFHLWRVGERSLAAIISIVTHSPKPPEHYKELIGGIPQLKHITIEVNGYPDEP